jgi:hypothetical protein
MMSMQGFDALSEGPYEPKGLTSHIEEMVCPLQNSSQRVH